MKEKYPFRNVKYLMNSSTKGLFKAGKAITKNQHNKKRRYETMIKANISNNFFNGTVYFKNTTEYNNFYYLWIVLGKHNKATFEIIEGLKSETFKHTYKNDSLLYNKALIFANFETEKDMNYFKSLIENHEKSRKEHFAK